MERRETRDKGGEEGVEIGRERSAPSPSSPSRVIVTSIEPEEEGEWWTRHRPPTVH